MRDVLEFYCGQGTTKESKSPCRASYGSCMTPTRGSGRVKRSFHPLADRVGSGRVKRYPKRVRRFPNLTGPVGSGRVESDHYSHPTRERFPDPQISLVAREERNKKKGGFDICHSQGEKG